MARLVSEEDSEIVLEVPTGDTVLGRGPLLKITDKRVSRNHASLEWRNGNLRLCSRHHNPCFLRSAGGSSYCPLTRDTWVELHHGDHISLLPDSLIYRVELRLENEGEGEVEEKEEETPAGCQQTQSVDEERSPVAVRGDMSTAVFAQQEREEEKEQDRSEVAASTGRKRALPAWLSDVRVEPKTTASKAARKPASKKRDTVVTSSEAAVAEPSRTTTSVQKDVDNVVMTTLFPDSPTPDGTGKKAAGEAALSDEEPAPKAESPVPSGDTTSSSKLPPCPYGAECYRKNPSHFYEYSHETVDERDKPECPYGADCYRKNPAHRKNYKHPGPPADPPTAKRVRQTRTRRKKPRVSALAGESDDSQGPNAYDYTDSFIDDEEMSSESTSYGGDSEDSEWAPPSGGEGRGGDREGSLEADVTELREEANSFITNKKMWRS